MHVLSYLFYPLDPSFVPFSSGPSEYDHISEFVKIKPDQMRKYREVVH